MIKVNNYLDYIMKLVSKRAFAGWGMLKSIYDIRGYTSE
jgi:hypothetical protein